MSDLTCIIVLKLELLSLKPLYEDADLSRAALHGLYIREWTMWSDRRIGVFWLGHFMMLIQGQTRGSRPGTRKVFNLTSAHFEL